MQSELTGRIDQLTEALARLQGLPLEGLPADAAANQLYREVNQLRGVVEGVAQNDPWGQVGHSITSLADDLATRLEAPLERLPIEASQRQLYDEIVGLKGALQQELDGVNRRQRAGRAQLAQLEKEVAQLRAEIAAWREHAAQAPAPAGVDPQTRAVLARMDGRIEALAGGLRGGADSAIYRDSPAVIERLHGAMEMMRQSQGAARFAASDRPSPFQAGAWTRIAGGRENGSWAKGYRIRGFCSHDGRLYATVVSPETPQATGVWSWAGGRWRQELSNLAEPDIADGEANALLVSGGRVHVAVSALSGGLWREGPDGFEPACDQPMPGAYCLAEYDGGVVVGCDPAEIYLCRDGKRERIAGGGEMDSWFAAEIDGGVYTLAVLDGDLYAGMALRTYGPASTTVWRLRAGRWEVVGGEGRGGSWTHPHIGYLLDLTPFQGRMLACLSRPRTMPLGASSVYALEGDDWLPVAPGAVPWRMHRSHIFNHGVEWRGRYYLATGDARSDLQASAGARAAVWELADDGGGWTCVGGGAERPAWAETPLESLHLGDERTGGLWIYRMHVHADRLVCGFAGHERAAEIWMFTPDDAAPLPTEPDPPPARRAARKPGPAKRAPAKASAAKPTPAKKAAAGKAPAKKTPATRAKGAAARPAKPKA